MCCKIFVRVSIVRFLSPYLVCGVENLLKKTLFSLKTFWVSTKPSLYSAKASTKPTGLFDKMYKLCKWDNRLQLDWKCAKHIIHQAPGMCGSTKVIWVHGSIKLCWEPTSAPPCYSVYVKNMIHIQKLLYFCAVFVTRVQIHLWPHNAVKTYSASHNLMAPMEISEPQVAYILQSNTSSNRVHFDFHSITVRIWNVIQKTKKHSDNWAFCPQHRIKTAGGQSTFAV